MQNAQFTTDDKPRAMKLAFIAEVRHWKTKVKVRHNFILLPDYVSTDGFSPLGR